MKNIEHVSFSMKKQQLLERGWRCFFLNKKYLVNVFKTITQEAAFVYLKDVGGCVNESC